MEQTGGSNSAQPSLLLSLAWMIVTASLTSILSGVQGILISVLMYHTHIYLYHISSSQEYHINKSIHIKRNVRVCVHCLFLIPPPYGPSTQSVPVCLSLSVM